MVFNFYKINQTNLRSHRSSVTILIIIIFISKKKRTFSLVFLLGDSVFRQMGKRALQPTVTGALAKAMRCFTPKLFDLLKMRTFPEEINSFFTNVVSQTMKQRTETNYGRNDFLQLMMQLRDAAGTNIAKNDIGYLFNILAWQTYFSYPQKR